MGEKLSKQDAHLKRPTCQTTVGIMIWISSAFVWLTTNFILTKDFWNSKKIGKGRNE